MSDARKRSLGSVIGGLAVLNLLFAFWTFGDLRADEAEVGCWKPTVDCECYGAGMCQEWVIIPGAPCSYNSEC